jgi:leucyl/phenylalanyl-tRNA--protein transferase
VRGKEEWLPGQHSRFPDPRGARGDIVTLGDDLTTDALRDAYFHGIFPWPVDGLPLPWFSPRHRAILDFGELRVDRSLRRSLKKNRLTFTIDKAFERVIEACAGVSRPDQGGTWIVPEIIGAYVRLHLRGDAHSVEAWDEGRLVGGLYGVDAGGLFTGESMFHLQADASKLALLYLIRHLASREAGWIDIQQLTPHMARLGARDIARTVFLDRLAATQAKGLLLFGQPGTLPGRTGP